MKLIMEKLAQIQRKKKINESQRTFNISKRRHTYHWVEILMVPSCLGGPKSHIGLYILMIYLEIHWRKRKTAVVSYV